MRFDSACVQQVPNRRFECPNREPSSRGVVPVVARCAARHSVVVWVGGLGWPLVGTSRVPEVSRVRSSFGESAGLEGGWPEGGSSLTRADNPPYGTTLRGVDRKRDYRLF